MKNKKLQWSGKMNNKFLAVLGVLGLVACSVVAKAGASLPTIHPTPKQMELKSKTKLQLDGGWVIVADSVNERAKFNADYLKRNLQTEFNLDISVVSPTSSRAARSKRIILANGSNGSWWQSFLANADVTNTSMLGDEGYLLETFKESGRKEIVLFGNTAKGVFYAIQSMLKHPDGTEQFITTSRRKTVIPCVKILDWPDRPVRGAFGLHEKNEALFGHINDLADGFAAIDILARLKMNAMVAGEYIEQLPGLDELYAYARLRNVEPIPYLRAFSHGWSMAEEDARVADGFNSGTEMFTCAWDGSQFKANPVIPIDQTQRMQNPGFEQTDASGWSFSDPNLWSIDTSTSSEGGASLAFSRSALDINQELTDVKVIPENVIPTSSGEVLTISFDVKASNIENQPFPLFRVGQLTQNKVRTQHTDPRKTSVPLAGGTYDWKNYEISIFAAELTRFLELSVVIAKNGTGQLWVDNIEVRRMNGALVNVIRTDATNIQLRDPTTGQAWSEGVDYSVSDEPLEFLTNIQGRKIRFSSRTKPWSINCAADGGIEPGKPFEVSYDFIVQMVKGQFKNPVLSPYEPLTYQVHTFPFLDEMISTLKPVSVLYAGNSETKGFNRDSRSVNLENYQVLQDDMISTYAFLKGLDPALKIYLWDDMINPWHNGDLIFYSHFWGGRRLGKIEPKDLSLPRATDAFPREDVIIWSWAYSHNAIEKVQNTGPYFEQLGFSWVGSPFQEQENVDDWGAAMAAGQNNLGMMLWSPTYSRPGNFRAAAETSWNVK